MSQIASTLERLNVINNGFSRPVWTIESAQGKLYLKGERSTALSGINKFMIFCDDGTPLLYTIFDPVGRDKEVMAMPAHSLMIDGRVYPVKAVSREMKNGWFNSVYRLSNRETGALRSANHVGLVVRFAPYAAGSLPGFRPHADIGWKRQASWHSGTIANNCATHLRPPAPPSRPRCLHLRPFRLHQLRSLHPKAMPVILTDRRGARRMDARATG